MSDTVFQVDGSQNVFRVVEGKGSVYLTVVQIENASQVVKCGLQAARNESRGP